MQAPLCGSTTLSTALRMATCSTAATSYTSKPDGFAKLKLKVGEKVAADGDAHFLSTGGGWAVEASSVNGKSLE